MRGRTLVPVAASGVATAVWLGPGAHLGSLARLTLLLLAIGAYGFACRRVDRGSSGPTESWATATIALTVLGVAVALAPRGSQDVWSYVMYGRTVAEHHASPYLHPPEDFAGDPFLELVGQGWRDARSVYGPAFMLLSAFGALLAGGSTLVARLFHQALAAGVVVAVALGVRRFQPHVPVFVCFVMNPAVIAGVNSGHNDLLVGGCLLGGVALAAARRPVLAGAALSAAVLVKVIAGLAVVGVLWWVWRRHGAGSAGRLGTVCGVMVAAAYLAAGGWVALEPVLDTGSQRSRASPWSSPQHWLGNRPSQGAFAATVIVVALVAVALVNRRRWHDAPTPAPAAAGLLVTLLFASPYVLPAYSGWVLPLSATLHGTRLAAIARWQAFALLIAYVDRPGGSPTGLLALLSAVALPVAAAASLAVVGADHRRRRVDEPGVGPTHPWRSRAG